MLNEAPDRPDKVAARAAGEQRFWAGFAEHSALLLAVRDIQGRYLFANRLFIDTFGLGERFRPGLTGAELFSPGFARLFDTPAADSGFFEQAFPIAEDRRVFLVNRFTVGDGVVGWAAHEITSRARAENDLLTSREFFKGILDIADDAVISVDQNQKIILFNQGAERIFRYAAEEALGRPLDMLLPETSRAAHGGHVASFRRSPTAARQMGERGSIRGRRKDGAEFPAEASISRMMLDGRPVFTAILRDVTKVREAERAIKALNEDLSQRAVQLENANRELEAFSYSVSHDLRAPLRTISSFSQVVVEDYGDMLDEQGRDYLARIRDASQRMAQLIDDILNLSRLTRGGLARTPLDLSRMARGIAQELQASQPTRQVGFDIAEGILAEGDPHLIQTALVNLLGNAWKYTSKKAVAHIDFGAFEDSEGRRVFFVRDDGAGFEMAYADKLFGAFQRLHGMKEFPGNGVGLATVQRIIHKHGGEVWAEAEPERGATFFFTLA